MNNKPNVQTVAYWMIILLCGGYLLYIGSSFILPLIYATLLAIFLYPIDKRILKVVRIKPLSIIISFLTIIVPLGLVGSLFTMQLMNIVSSLPSIESNLKLGIDKLVQRVENVFPAFDFKFPFIYFKWNYVEVSPMLAVP